MKMEGKVTVVYAKDLWSEILQTTETANNHWLLILLLIALFANGH
jgi:hypothetical protein